MSTSTIAPKEFLDYVEAHSTDFINRLAEAVAIKRYVCACAGRRDVLTFAPFSSSVSNDAELRPEVIQMSNWMKCHLKTYGVETAAIQLGTGTEVPQLPPVIVGRIGTDPAKKTVLVYGHLDVQPVSALLISPLCSS